MTLEELLNAEITAGTLNETRMGDVPVAMTVITREDIAVSPARNIADLIETYVPGATFVSHQSNRIGIRGIIIDRSYKLLLLVNGRNLNNKTNQGAVLELQNWDLGDIDRIEVIRGPGSVTYGPGAIAGVINIITKRKADSPGGTVGLDYLPAYRSRGMHVDYGFNAGQAGIYAYLSRRETDGVAHSKYFSVDANTGASGYRLESSGISHYYEDMLGPQMKAFVDVRFPREWRLWLRYTNSGMPDTIDGQPEGSYAGTYLPKRFEADKGFEAFVENKREINDRFSFENRVGFTTQQELQIMQSVSTESYNIGIYNYLPDPGNVHFGLAENALSWEGIARFKRSEKSSGALGAGYSREWVSSPYLFDITLKDDSIAGGFTSRKAADGRYLQDVVGDGFTTWMGSLFGEWEFRPDPRSEIRVSGRADKNKYAPMFFSPRLAWLSRLDDRRTLRFSLQRSVRMNTLLESYCTDYQGLENKPETLEAFEAIYGFQPRKDLLIEVPFYRYNLNAIGWNAAIAKTVPLGQLRFFGFEPGITYQGDKVKAGISHSFVRQLSWSKDAVTQGISYADVSFTAGGLTFNGEGNNINNFPEQSTKLHATVKDLFNGITAHADMQIFWNYQGKRDGVEVYRQGNAGDAAMEALAATLHDKDFGGRNMKLNLSLSKSFKGPKNEYSVTLYGMNLLGMKRYIYDAARPFRYPFDFSWIKEPVAFGMRIESKF